MKQNLCNDRVDADGCEVEKEVEGEWDNDVDGDRAYHVILRVINCGKEYMLNKYVWD